MCDVIKRSNSQAHPFSPRAFLKGCGAWPFVWVTFTVPCHKLANDTDTTVTGTGISTCRLLPRSRRRQLLRALTRSSEDGTAFPRFPDVQPAQQHSTEVACRANSHSRQGTRTEFRPRSMFLCPTWCSLDRWPQDTASGYWHWWGCWEGHRLWSPTPGVSLHLHQTLDGLLSRWASTFSSVRW